MGTPLLSSETERRIALLFHPEQQDMVRIILLERCANNFPLLMDCDEIAMERFHFAALKLSDGNVDKLRSAVNLAKTDWRDLLGAAGFARDINVHKSWLPEQIW